MYLENGILILKALGPVFTIAWVISGHFLSMNLKHCTHYLQSSKIYHSMQRSMASTLSTVQGFMPIIAKLLYPPSAEPDFQPS